MANNKIFITNGFCPIARIHLNQNEKCYIQQGSMIFKTPHLKLKGKLNSNGSGVGKLFSAIGRSVVSGESIILTEVSAHKGSGVVAIAPSNPGSLTTLDIGQNQYYLNDGSFIAMTENVKYITKRQKISQAMFGNSGGLFIMKTDGFGEMVLESYGTIQKIHLENDTLSVDNGHVLAWSDTLNYSLNFETGFISSFFTEEGLVNTFSGTGDIYVQSLSSESYSNGIVKIFQKFKNKI